MKIYWTYNWCGWWINDKTPRYKPQPPKPTGNNGLRNIIKLLAYDRLNNIKINQASVLNKCEEIHKLAYTYMSLYL